MKLHQLFHSAWKSDLIIKIGQTFAARIGQLTISLLTSVLIARGLGPEGRGVFAVASAVSGIIVQIANLGLHSANTYYVARTDGRAVGALSGNAILLSLISIPVCIVIWVGFHYLGDNAPLKGVILVLALSAVPIALLYMQLQNIILGLQEVKPINTVELIVSLSGLMMMAVIVVEGIAEVTLIYAVTIVTQIIGVCALMIWVFRHGNTRFSISIDLLGRSLSYGFKAYISTIFSFLVFRVDTLMVSHFRGDRETGQYAIAMSLINMMYILPTVAATLVFAKMCGMHDIRERILLGVRYGAAVSAIMVLAAMLAMPLSEWIVTFLFGVDFVAAAKAFVCLLPGLLAMSGEIIVRKALTSDGYHKGVLWNWGIGFLVNLFLNWILIPSYGISGAAMASSSAIALVALLNLVLLYREWKMADA